MEGKTGFASNLFFIIRYHGLKKEDLANGIGVAPNTISGWLNGTRRPTKREQEILFLYLGLSYHDLSCEGLTDAFQKMEILKRNDDLQNGDENLALFPIFSSEMPDECPNFRYAFSWHKKLMLSGNDPVQFTPSRIESGERITTGTSKSGEGVS